MVATSSIAPMFQLKRVGAEATISAVKDHMRLVKSPCVFGRKRAAVDYYLDSKSYAQLISRQHATIRFNPDETGSMVYQISDTSLNGTYVNDVRVNGQRTLKEGDVIMFGHLNGVNVKPGEYAPQRTSEFKFRFEKVPDEDLNNRDHSGMANHISLSHLDKKGNEFNQHSKVAQQYIPHGRSLSQHSAHVSHKLHTASHKAANKTSGTKTDDASPLVMGDKTLCYSSGKGENVPRRSASIASDTSIQSEDVSIEAEDEVDKDVAELASRAGGDMERFDEPFSVNESSSSTVSRSDFASHRDSSRSKSPLMSSWIGNAARNSFYQSDPLSVIPSANRSNIRNKSLSSLQQKKKKRGPKRKNRGRKRKLTEEAGSDVPLDDDYNWHYDDDECASKRCTKPVADNVVWVQCDACEKWYHTECCGMDPEEVVEMETFHCGCLVNRFNKP